MRNRRHSSLLKFFPVPAYLRMPAVGMDISEISIRFIEILPSKEGDGFTVGKYGERRVPPGVISKGEIKDPAVFRDVLRKMKRDFNLSFVRASLSEAHAYLAEVEIPVVSQRQLRESLELQIEEYVPFSAGDIFFDYAPIPEIFNAPEKNTGKNTEKSTEENTEENMEKRRREEREKNESKPKTMRLVVTAVPKEPVFAYMEAFASAGLSLVSVETDAAALTRAILSPKDGGAALVIEVGRVKTGIYVAAGGIVRFLSEVDVGAYAVGRTDADRKENQEEGEGVSVKAEKEKGKELVEFFERIKNEAEKHRAYWNSRHDISMESSEKIRRVVLAGSHASLPGFAEYLTSVFSEPVVLANPWANVLSLDEEIPEIAHDDSFRYATAIGLALSPYQKFL